MLKWLKKSLSGDSAHRGMPAGATPPLISTRLPAGFLPVQTSDALVTGERRQQSLQIIQQVSSMPAPLYHTLCYQPLLALLERVQQVPAAEAGVWARQDGFGDLTLKFTACAVRLAKGYMFPPGAAPEEQSAQSSAWNAMVFWSALFHHLPLLAHLEGELLSGEGWMPGMTVPDQAYRCRFRHTASSGAEASAMASLMAGQLLPAEAVRWLSDTPPVLRNLAGALWNGHPEMFLIRDILRQSAGIVAAPSMASAPPSLPVGNNAPAITPGIEPAVPPEQPAAVGQPVLASEMLLSELASSVPADASAAAPTASSPPVAPVEETTADPALPAVDIPPPDADGTDMLLSLFSAFPAAEGDPVEEDAVPDGNPADEYAREMAGSEDDAFVEAALPQNAEVVAAPVEPLPAAEALLPTMTADNSDEKGQSTGEMFFDWLRNGLQKNALPVNQPDAGIHLVSGFVFISVPDIFFNYGKATGDDSHRRAIQSSFERLGVHRSRGKERFSQARIYSDVSREGKYRQLNGYLVKATALYRRGHIPEDSPYISFK